MIFLQDVEIWENVSILSVEIYNTICIIIIWVPQKHIKTGHINKNQLWKVKKYVFVPIAKYVFYTSEYVQNWTTL